MKQTIEGCVDMMWESSITLGVAVRPPNYQEFGIRRDEEVSEVAKPEIKREIKPEDRLHRRWVGLLDVSGQEMVKRRSVILKIGLNQIRLMWTNGRSAVPGWSVLYLTEDAQRPFIGAGVVNPVPTPLIDFANGCSVTLNWDVKAT